MLTSYLARADTNLEINNTPPTPTSIQHLTFETEDKDPPGWRWVGIFRQISHSLTEPVQQMRYHLVWFHFPFHPHQCSSSNTLVPLNIQWMCGDPERTLVGTFDPRCSTQSNLGQRWQISHSPGNCLLWPIPVPMPPDILNLKVLFFSICWPEGFK